VTSGGQSSNLYLNVVFSTQLWQLKTVVFLHWSLHSVLLGVTTLIIMTFSAMSLGIIFLIVILMPFYAVVISVDMASVMA
jgi:hypothetical protein